MATHIAVCTQAHKLACRIYVGSLNYDLRPADITQLFSTVGRVVSVDMNFDHATGRNKACSL
jgi:RNA recognition motif-containing protein